MAEAATRRGLYPLMVAGRALNVPAEEIERNLLRGHFLGYKVYLNWFGNDYGEIRVEDMIGPAEMQVADRHGQRGYPFRVFVRGHPRVDRRSRLQQAAHQTLSDKARGPGDESSGFRDVSSDRVQTLPQKLTIPGQRFPQPLFE